MPHYEGIQGMIFELNKGLFREPIQLDFMQLYQVGEIGLNCGGEILEHENLCHEITYVVSGEGMLYTNGVPKTVSQGSIHIISKGKQHRIISSSASKLRYIYIGFGFAEKRCPAELRELIEFYSDSTEEIRYDVGSIRLLLDLMINELYSETKYSNIIFETCLKQVLIYIFRLYHMGHPKYYIPDQGSYTIGQTAYSVVRYIDSHVLEIESVKDVADKLGYTSSYLSHLFKEKMGKGILNYITEKKIETASDLLKNDKFSITEISQYLNYNSPQAFCKVFKKQTGMSPTEFKKCLR